MIIHEFADMAVAGWWTTAKEDIAAEMALNAPCGEPMILSAARLKHRILEDKTEAAAGEAFDDDEERDLFMLIGPCDVWEAYRKHPELSVTRQRAKTREGRREAFVALLDRPVLKELGERFGTDLLKRFNDELWRI